MIDGGSKVSKIVKVGAIVFVVVLIGALLGGAAVFAQDEAPAQPATGNGTFGRGAGRGASGAGLLAADEVVHQAMADALGISVETLDAEMAAGKSLVVIAAEQGVDIGVVRDAMEAARAGALEQAVAEGLITQEQANWMQNQGNRGRAGAAGGPHLGDEAHGLGLVDETAVHEAMAAALGMSVEDLDAALAEGKTLVVIAAEQGVDIGVVRDAMQAARADALQTAVAEGLITQEQANWMQNQGNRGPQAGGQGAGRAAGNGSMGGRGGRMGGNGAAGSGRALGGYAGDCPLSQTP
jgi:hypothetical protein